MRHGTGVWNGTVSGIFFVVNAWRNGGTGTLVLPIVLISLNKLSYILGFPAPKTPVMKKEIVFQPIPEEEDEVDLDQYLDQLDGDIKELCETLQNQK